MNFKLQRNLTQTLPVPWQRSQRHHGALLLGDRADIRHRIGVPVVFTFLSQELPFSQNPAGSLPVWSRVRYQQCSPRAG